MHLTLYFREYCSLCHAMRDALRPYQARHGFTLDVIDVDSFDFALFNEAEEKGDAVLTCGAWSGVHPAFVGVPFLCGREVPVFLHYPLAPTLQVQKFVNAMAQLLK